MAADPWAGRGGGPSWLLTAARLVVLLAIVALAAPVGPAASMSAGEYLPDATTDSSRATVHDDGELDVAPTHGSGIGGPFLTTGDEPNCRMLDGTYIGAVDRIVDGETAVILLEADGEVVDQLDIDVTRLPADGQHEGAILEVEVERGEYVDATYLPERTTERTERMQDRLDRLSTPLSDEDA